MELCRGEERPGPLSRAYLSSLFLGGLISLGLLLDWLRCLPCVPVTQEL